MCVTHLPQNADGHRRIFCRTDVRWLKRIYDLDKKKRDLKLARLLDSAVVTHVADAEELLAA